MALQFRKIRVTSQQKAKWLHSVGGNGFRLEGLTNPHDASESAVIGLLESAVLFGFPDHSDCPLLALEPTNTPWVRSGFAQTVGAAVSQEEVGGRGPASVVVAPLHRRSGRLGRSGGPLQHPATPLGGTVPRGH